MVFVVLQQDSGEKRERRESMRRYLSGDFEAGRSAIEGRDGSGDGLGISIVRNTIGSSWRGIKESQMGLEEIRKCRKLYEPGVLGSIVQVMFTVEYAN